MQDVARLFGQERDPVSHSLDRLANESLQQELAAMSIPARPLRARQEAKGAPNAAHNARAAAARSGHADKAMALLSEMRARSAGILAQSNDLLQYASLRAALG